MVPQESTPEWFVHHMWALWLLAGLVLGATEMITLDFTLLMLASGAVAGGITAAVAPHAYWLQALVAALVAVFSLMVVRPTILRRVREAPGYRNSLEKLVGSQALTSGPVSSTEGQITVNGDTWAARTVDDDTWIPPGTLVDVYEVDGLHLVVQAVDPTRRQLPPHRRPDADG